MSRPKGWAGRSTATRAAIVGAVLLVTVLRAAAGGAMSQSPGSTTTDWPVNAKGQAYGSETKATSEADAPDLVSVMATNGRIGYCLNTQLNPPPNPPKTIEQAQEMRRASLCYGRVIPVYASDGTTQIGVFKIGGPGTANVTEKPDGTTITQTGNADGTSVTTTKLPDGSITTKTE